MSATTPIEWTDRSWNPVRGCSVISPGCVNCYAMKFAHRFSAPGKPYHGLTKMTKAGPQWTGAIRTVDEALLEPLSWKKPQRIFVNSMSDLFHEGVPDAFIDQVFNVMAYSPQHTFQVLTKRPERMQRYLADPNRPEAVFDALYNAQIADRLGRKADDAICRGMDRVESTGVECFRWPLPHVWLGVSAEEQKHADERVPLLLQTPAAVRFISAEPLLGPVDLRRWLGGHPERLSWVIAGGESGPRARKADPDWFRSVRDQCAAAGVAFFMKQMTSRAPIPSDLLVRQYPDCRNWRYERMAIKDQAAERDDF